MKNLIAVILFFFSSILHADIEVKFRPEKPVLNESFEMEVVISFEGGEEPFVSFDPGGLTVEERRKGGVAFTTQLINGQFSSQKTITYVYQLRANRAGTFYIRDLVVKLDSGDISKDNVRVVVLREAEKPKDYFLEAIPSKDKVYKGEGFYLDYYLYTRVPIYSQELKEYPKLNGFLKKFKNIDETPERVERSGLIYQRSKKYSARLYAEKTGKLTADPLKLQVGIGYGNGVGGFGFRDIRNVTLSSAPVEIEVSEAAADSVPKGYTGLVGEHSFNLLSTKDKYLVNEPIELKLEIVGPGLLEKMDSPVLYSHPDLESFDTRSEIQEISPTQSRRIIEYTYLPRSNMEIAGRSLDLSYFLPDKKEYKTVRIEIPAIQVVGVSANSTSIIKSDEQRQQTAPQIVMPKIIETLSPVSPFGFGTSIGLISSPVRVAFWISVFVFLLSLLSNINISKNVKRDKLWSLYKKTLKKGVTYKSLMHFLTSTSNESATDLVSAVDELEVSNDVKNYFIDLIKELRLSTYSSGSSGRQIKPNHKMFKRFVKEVT